MSAIWIVLLDTSSSMDEGFPALPGALGDPLAETGAWARKIDAAKDILIRQVSSLRAQDIAIIQFTSEARKIFHGTRDAFLRDTSAVTSISPFNGTSIAAALDAVTTDPAFESYRSLSVLLLTDGQSDLAEATQAANNLVSKYPFARIDSIIIGETNKGRVVVDAVSINGTVRNATSTVQLETAVSAARASGLQGELENMAFARFAAQRELARIQEVPAPTLIQVTSGETLTAKTLMEAISPTLLALESFDAAEGIVHRKKPLGRISSISQDSPISINLTGLKEVVQLVLEYVIPWRREHARRLSELEIRKREIEIECSENNNFLLDYELEQRKLDLAKSQLEVAKSKWELAERMLREIDPNEQLRGEERLAALRQFFVGIDHLARTQLEFRVVRERPQ